MPSTKIETRPTKDRGRGIFSTKAIKRGEVIERSPVILVPKKEGDRLLNSILGRYMFETDDNSRFVVALGFASLINHDDNPNAEFFVSSETITIKARRAIAKGVEVTHDYGWEKEDWESIGVILPKS